MSSTGFEAARITDRVWWVGAIDWEIRDFHGYATSRGSTYNAYLVMADKVTLVDTVKAPFRDEMMARIASVVDPAKIDYIVSNHSEMDHSGSLPETITRVKPDKVFASPMGVKALGAHFGLDGIEPLKTGDELSLGNLTLKFLETRMLHWPDSMVSYLAEEKLLFSQDGFGMHLASGERFADELDPAVLRHEAAKYYANILLPYSGLITKLLATVKELGLEVDFLCPDHGPVWRKGFDILGWYADWAQQEPTMKAVVAYATMWHSTERMAHAIGDGLAAGGASPRLLPVPPAHRSDVMTELLEAGAFLVGSPTINNQVFPSMADLLCYARGLKPLNKVGQVFGSYGWSGEATKQLAAELEAMKVELVAEPIRVNYVPTDADLDRCRKLGLEVAAKMKERVA
ncbi:FprA family A-type flavoprotein [candidate division WOR-3 bacterium]|nr:FprA family A-type flavoprotein [candidate division WOR-3 bacterium]